MSCHVMSAWYLDDSCMGVLTPVVEFGFDCEVQVQEWSGVEWSGVSQVLVLG